MTVADSEGLQLFANELINRTARIARVWHSETTAEVVVRSDVSSIVFLQIEGTSTITQKGAAGSQNLTPGGVAVFPAGSAFTMSSTSGVARYELGFDLANLPATLHSAIASGLIVNDPEPGYYHAVVGAANSALGFDMKATDAGFSTYILGISLFLTSLLVEALEARRPAPASRVDSLYATALRAIEQESRDPDFTVSTLASRTGVSLRYLHRVFEQNGTTPKAALSDERARTARVYLSTPETRPRLTKDAIARLSGFHDAKALRRAFAGLEDDSAEG